jgi:hypothetical protein
MELGELTRWLLLGLVSQEDLEKEWSYHSSANYELLMQFIAGAAKFGAGNPEKEIEFLEVRLPLVLYRKDNHLVDPNVKFVLELYKEGYGRIRTNQLDIEPGDNIANQLQKHMGAHSYKILRI